MRESMKEILNGVNVKPGTKPRLVARSTVRYTDTDGNDCFRFHHTDVVKVNRKGAVILNSGGWRTSTTKGRIAAFAPGLGVYQKGGLWYVNRNGESVPFYDGIRIDPGKPLPGSGADKAREEKALAKSILKFVRKLDSMPEVPTPSNGDCWLCWLKAPKPVERNALQFTDNTAADTEAGEPLDNVDHLREHIREGYLHGSLIVNAMRWAGYSDTGIGHYYSMANGSNESSRRSGRDAFKRTLRRYLRRKLGIG